ncbi:MAG: rubrerythrin, partial [Francisellaceae bacterium]
MQAFVSMNWKCNFCNEVNQNIDNTRFCAICGQPRGSADDRR